MELELERRFGRWLQTEKTLNKEELLHQTRHLYRELVEAIQRKERDGESALSLELVHRTLYGCCAMVSLGGAERLEGVLGALELSPSLWVRIVEIAVRSGGLQGKEVLMLRECEEAVLERLAWAEPGGGPQATATPIPLALFMRKLYHLASARIAKLSSRLGLPAELQQRVWTCLELCFTRCPFLLHGRHLDHILLSSIYVACILSNQPKTFIEILRIYRENGGSSSVYRRVLLSPPDRYGDLIQFYNTVYVAQMRGLLCNLGLPPPSTPLPPPPTPLSSPSRGVIVRLLCPENLPSPSPLPSYTFSSSPRSNLVRINEMVAASAVSRRLSLPPSPYPSRSRSLPPNSTLRSRISSILEDRKATRREY